MQGVLEDAEAAEKSGGELAAAHCEIGRRRHAVCAGEREMFGFFCVALAGQAGVAARGIWALSWRAHYGNLTFVWECQGKRERLLRLRAVWLRGARDAAVGGGQGIETWREMWKRACLSGSTYKLRIVCCVGAPLHGS